MALCPAISKRGLSSMHSAVAYGMCVCSAQRACGASRCTDRWMWSAVSSTGPRPLKNPPLEIDHHEVAGPHFGPEQPERREQEPVGVTRTNIVR